MTTAAQPQAPSELNGHHRKTYEALFRHPISHNLEWHDVRALLEALGEVTEAKNGAIHASRNGQTLVLHAPKQKVIDSADDIKAICHFLERSAAATAKPTAAAPGANVLVVIDHQEAKIYRAEGTGAEHQKLVPYDPHGFGRHLHSDTQETDGKRKPERKSYYESVAATLRGADKILLFGGGTGESSAMDQLLADLHKNHRDVAEHVVATVVVDAHHQTEVQLLAKAREMFGS